MSGDGIAVMAKPADGGTEEYTFSMSRARKKKRGKKIRAKKFITAEEAAVSKRSCLARSQSLSALQTSEKAQSLPDKKKPSSPKAIPVVVVTPPPPPPPSMPAPEPETGTSSDSGSPLGKEGKGSPTKSRGQVELELELGQSPSGNIRKPWETDIRKKNKTEYGESLLRDGPVVTERIATNRAASHHMNYRRARSLSTTRHRSLSSRSLGNRRYRSPSSHRALRCSEWDFTDDEESFSQNDDERSEFTDDTYEKYRQFLSSSKNMEADDSMSRQSVLSLKQKVGAAPSLEFSYRYSAAADELLNAYEDEMYLTKAEEPESKTNTEEMTHASEPESLALENEGSEKIWEPPVFLGAVSNDNDPNDESDDDEKMPTFLGAVVHNDDEVDSAKEEETASDDKESSSIVKEQSALDVTVCLDAVSNEIDPSNDNDDEQQPAYPGAVVHDDDASVNSEDEENICSDKESSSIVEAESTSEIPMSLDVVSNEIDQKSESNNEEKQPIFLGSLVPQDDTSSISKNEENSCNEKESPSIVEERETLELPMSQDDDPSSESDSGESQPVFVGDVAHDSGASISSNKSEESFKDQKSSSVVEERAEAPLQLPISPLSVFSPFSACSRSPLLACSSIKKEVPPPPIEQKQEHQQERQQEHDNNEEKISDVPRSSPEIIPSHEKESFNSSQNNLETEKSEKDCPLMVVSEEKEKNATIIEDNVVSSNERDDEPMDPGFDRVLQQDDCEEIGNDNKSSSREPTEEIPTRQVTCHIDEIEDEVKNQVDENNSILRTKDLDSEIPPLLKRSPTRCVDSDDDDKPLEGSGRGFKRTVNTDEAKPLPSLHGRNSPTRSVDTDGNKPLEGSGRSLTRTVSADEAKLLPSLGGRNSPTRSLDTDEDKPIHVFGRRKSRTRIVDLDEDVPIESPSQRRSRTCSIDSEDNKPIETLSQVENRVEKLQNNSDGQSDKPPNEHQKDPISLPASIARLPATISDSKDADQIKENSIVETDSITGACISNSEVISHQTFDDENDETPETRESTTASRVPTPPPSIDSGDFDTILDPVDDDYCGDTIFNSDEINYQSFDGENDEAPKIHESNTATAISRVPTAPPSIDSDHFDAIFGPVDDDSCGHTSPHASFHDASNPQSPEKNSGRTIERRLHLLVQNETPKHDLEEGDPIQGLFGQSKEFSQESTNFPSDDDIDEESSSQHMEEEDPEYPEEDRNYMSLLYDIYMN